MNSKQRIKQLFIAFPLISIQCLFIHALPKPQNCIFATIVSAFTATEADRAFSLVERVSRTRCCIGTGARILSSRAKQNDATVFCALPRPSHLSPPTKSNLLSTSLPIPTKCELARPTLKAFRRRQTLFEAKGLGQVLPRDA